MNLDSPLEANTISKSNSLKEVLFLFALNIILVY